MHKKYYFIVYTLNGRICGHLYATSLQEAKAKLLEKHDDIVRLRITDNPAEIAQYFPLGVTG